VGSIFACRMTTVKHAHKNVADGKGALPNVREVLQAAACQRTMTSVPASRSESPSFLVVNSVSRRTIAAIRATNCDMKQLIDQAGSAAGVTRTFAPAETFVHV
jgi:hypothetical protein